MKISVIIPTYARAQMLPRAIESVLGQEGVDVEVVVVSDNPPESPARAETRAQIEALHDSRIVFLENDKNMGGSLTRNRGIEASTGDYISFIDDDDFYLPGKLREQLDFMVSGNFDMTFMDCEIRNSEGTTMDIRTHGLPGAPDNNTLLRAHLVSPLTPTMTYMFRRDALFELGLFENRPVSQEYMLMLRAINKGLKIGYLPRALSVQIVHSGERISAGANKIPGEKRLLEVKLGYKDVLSSKERRMMKCRFYSMAFFVSFRQKKMLDAAGYALRAFAATPVGAVKILLSKKGMFRAKEIDK